MSERLRQSALFGAREVAQPLGVGITGPNYVWDTDALRLSWETTHHTNISRSPQIEGKSLAQVGRDVAGDSFELGFR